MAAQWNAVLDEENAYVVERELHSEIVPGTEVMKDVAGLHFVRQNGTSVSPKYQSEQLVASNFKLFSHPLCCQTVNQ